MADKNTLSKILSEPLPKRKPPVLSDIAWEEPWSQPYGTPVMDAEFAAARERLSQAGTRSGLKPSDPGFNAALLQDVLAGGSQYAAAPVTAATQPVTNYLAKVLQYLGGVPSPVRAFGSRSERDQANADGRTIGNDLSGLARSVGSLLDSGSDAIGYPREYGREATGLAASVLAPTVLSRMVPGLAGIGNRVGGHIGVPENSYMSGPGIKNNSTQTGKVWTTPQTRDLGVDFGEALKAYNEDVPDLKFQYDQIGNDYRFPDFELRDAQELADDMFDGALPPELQKLVDERGNIGYRSFADSDDGEFIHSSNAPTKEELMLEALGDDYAKPATSIADAHKNVGTRWGENSNAMALMNIAKQLGFDVQNASRTNWNRYNDFSRPLNAEERSRLSANGLDPDDHQVSLKARTSDHTQTSRQHREPDINLSPEGDDFYDAAMRLADATIDKDGNLVFRRKPFPK